MQQHFENNSSLDKPGQIQYEMSLLRMGSSFSLFKVAVVVTQTPKKQSKRKEKPARQSFTERQAGKICRKETKEALSPSVEGCELLIKV